MDNKEKKKKDDWIRLASRSRPGRFYMFNKATGETQWLPLENEDGGTKQQKDSPPKLSISKASKTPAQDRLKRLQHNLKTNQTRSHSSRTTRTSNDLEAKTKHEQENHTNDQEPSTSSAAKEKKNKSPRKAYKRTQSDCLVNENESDKLEKSSKSTTSDEVKKLRLSDTFNSLETTTESNIGQVTETLKPLVANAKEQMDNVEDNNTSTLNNLRSGIVKKIKEICKIPFNVSKKLAEEKSYAKEDKSYGLINTNQFKATKKLKDNKNLNLSATQEAIISQFREENSSNISNESPRKSMEFSTPKNFNVPSYTRGSANSRLERLKQSLISQHQQQKPSSDTINDTEILNDNLNLSYETNNNTTTLLQFEDNIEHNNSTSTLYQTANNTVNDEIEAMDWQPIMKEEETVEPTNSGLLDSTLIIEKSKKLLLPKDDTEKLTMGDIYDTVNGNLLRFAAEKHKDSTNKEKKWHKDFYYFIVDTNVLLRDLTFVEDLTKMKLCDTKGSMLYIPYSVLQELDKLKMRSGLQEGVKTLAVRAIKYLNTKFENNSNHVQAQSAIDERKHLIDINSADDSIINCCLQAKEHVPNLLLLTEDINLRNKAICNNILVSTKSDLISKRYDSNVTNDKS